MRVWVCLSPSASVFSALIICLTRGGGWGEGGVEAGRGINQGISQKFTRHGSIILSFLRQLRPRFPIKYYNNSIRYFLTPFLKYCRYWQRIIDWNCHFITSWWRSVESFISIKSGAKQKRASALPDSGSNPWKWCASISDQIRARGLSLTSTMGIIDQIGLERGRKWPGRAIYARRGESSRGRPIGNEKRWRRGRQPRLESPQQINRPTMSRFISSTKFLFQISPCPLQLVP